MPLLQCPHCGHTQWRGEVQAESDDQWRFGYRCLTCGIWQPGPEQVVETPYIRREKPLTSADRREAVRVLRQSRGGSPL